MGISLTSKASAPLTSDSAMIAPTRTPSRAKWELEPSLHFKFKVLPNIFIQSDPSTIESAVGPVPTRFGLLDASPERWTKLDEYIDKLEAEAKKTVDARGEEVRYKLVFAGRHGEGWHNVAEAKYGTKAWDDYWAMLNGDDEIVWGPDPLLTPVGEGQAKVAASTWTTELEASIPLPKSLYSSPFTRALATARITFDTFSFSSSLSSSKSTSTASASSETRRKETLHPILIVEDIREVNGEHTCDMRSTATIIKKRVSVLPPLSSSASSSSPSVPSLPTTAPALTSDAIQTPQTETHGPVFEFEPKFAEEDETWTKEREPDEHVLVRAHKVLERIFEFDSARYVSITAHSGWITQLLATVGHRRYNLGTGGVIPLLVKATRVRE